MAIPFAATRLLPYMKKAGQFAWQNLKPSSAAEAAIRFGPDIFLWPALASGMAPEGTSAKDRFGIGAEDAAIGVGASILGQLAGLGAGRGLMKAGMAAKHLPTAVTLGDVAAGPLNIVSPRPIMNKVYSEAGLSQEEELRARIRAEEREKNEALLNLLLTGGAGALQNPAVRELMQGTIAR